MEGIGQKWDKLKNWYDFFQRLLGFLVCNVLMIDALVKRNYGECLKTRGTRNNYFLRTYHDWKWLIRSDRFSLR